MIPTRQQLDDVSRLREGTLQEIPFAVLTLALAVHRSTVVLELHRNQVEKMVVFDAGVPVDCRSNLANETLGRFMVSAGRLSDEDFTASFAQSASRGVPLGEILVEKGLITPFELFRILQQNLARKLLDGFTWREGQFRLHVELPDVASPLKVRVPQLLVTGLAKFAAQQDVDSSIVPLVGKPLALHPAPLFPLEEIKLSPRQSVVIEALRKPKRLDEIASSSELSYDEISRLLYALAMLGVVAPADQIPKGAAAPAPQPSRQPPVTPSPSPSSAPPLDPAAVERKRNDLMQSYLSFGRHDAFQLLGVPEDATPVVIQKAFLDMSRKFAPWSFSSPDLMSLSDKAEELYFASARAYAQLADPEQRNSLIHRRRTLREDKKVQDAASRYKVKTDLLDPEVQFRKGKELMTAGKYREAITIIEFASDCDAQNSLYRAELAYCRFLHSPTTVTGNQALRDLQEAVRIDPACGIAHFYAGEIGAATGARDQAEKSYRSAIKLMAPDRRPIDALKALERKK